MDATAVALGGTVARGARSRVSTGAALATRDTTRHAGSKHCPALPVNVGSDFFLNLDQYLYALREHA